MIKKTLRQWLVARTARFLLVPVFFALIGLNLYGLGAFWQSGSRYMTADFKAFYTAGALLNQNRGHQLYDHAVQEQTENAIFPGQSTFLPFIQPPFVAPIFAPLASLSSATAYYVWAACNLLLALWIGFLLRKPPFNATLGMLAPLAFLPVLIVISQGQTSLIVLLSLALCLRALRSERPFLAGLVLTLGLVKFHLVLPLILWLVIRKGWRAFAGTACGATLLGMLALAVGGLGVIADYVVLLRHREAWIYTNTNPNLMPNLNGLIYALCGRVSLMAWTLALALIGFALLWVLRKHLTGGSEFAVLIAVAVFISPHTNFHDLSLLFLPGMLAVQSVTEYFQPAPSTAIQRLRLTTRET